MKIIIALASDPYVDAIQFLKSVDKGGIPLVPSKMRSIVENLGLEYRRSETPEMIVQRIRDAVQRHNSTKNSDKEDFDSLVKHWRSLIDKYSPTLKKMNDEIGEALDRILDLDPKFSWAKYQKSK